MQLFFGVFFHIWLKQEPLAQHMQFALHFRILELLLLLQLLVGFINLQAIIKMMMVNSYSQVVT